MSVELKCRITTKQEMKKIDHSVEEEVIYISVGDTKVPLTLDSSPLQFDTKPIFAELQRWPEHIMTQLESLPEFRGICVSNPRSDSPKIRIYASRDIREEIVPILVPFCVHPFLYLEGDDDWELPLISRQQISQQLKVLKQMVPCGSSYRMCGENKKRHYRLHIYHIDKNLLCKWIWDKLSFLELFIVDKMVLNEEVDHEIRKTDPDEA